jgi:hypothetical protein
MSKGTMQGKRKLPFLKERMAKIPYRVHQDRKYLGIIYE